MPSLFQIAERLDRRGLRRPIAAAASTVMKLRGDDRRFGVDRHGRWVNAQPDATFVSPDVHTARYPQVEAVVLDYWCQFYRPQAGDIIVDVGAGIGEDAVVFGKLVGPSGRVIAVEAHPGTFAALQATVRATGLDNVLPLQRAIADRSGTLRIGNSEDHLGNSVISGNAEGVSVQAQSLDELGAELALPRIDLLKMNIEGAERLAVKGMKAIAPSVRQVAISCHDFIADRGGGNEFRTLHEVRQTLEDLGFTVRRRDHAPNDWTRDTLFGSRSG